jgi:superfamily II DNA or RNA helicase
MILKKSYYSSEDNLLEDLIRPCFKNYSQINIATAYFSLNVLIDLIDEIEELEKKNGKFFLIFDISNKKQIIPLVNSKYGKYIKQIQESILIEQNNHDSEKIERICQLIDKDILIIKLATQEKGGIFHLKNYIFSDNSSMERLVVSGSANMTRSALTGINNEELNVSDDFSIFMDKKQRFLKLWENEIIGTNVQEIKNAVIENIRLEKETLTFNDKNKEKLNVKFLKQLSVENETVHIFMKCNKSLDENFDFKKFKNISFYSKEIFNSNIIPIDKFDSDTGVTIYTVNNNYTSLISGQDKNHFRSEFEFVNTPINLRNHQIEALNSLLNNDYNGILKMATGSGKTITLIAATLKIAYSRSFFIVVLPRKTLGIQWEEEIVKFTNFHVLKVWSGQKWDEKINTFLKMKTSKPKIIITVDKTFYGDTFGKILNHINGDITFIADEMHTLSNIEKLTEYDKYFTNKIGLSATPFEDENIEILPEKEKFLKEFFEGVVYEFTLDDAIKAGILCEYNYYYKKVCLNTVESDEFSKLQSNISALLTLDRPRTQEENKILSSLNSKMKSILSNCDSKKQEFLNDILKDESRTKNSIIYCPSGNFSAEKSFDDKDNSFVISYMNKILEEVDHGYSKIFNNRLRLRIFTSKESLQDRANLLNEFKNSNIDGLAAIKCLDEGIDIPNAKNVYILESSSSNREFVQRRGRILRIYEGKTEANIFDYIVYKSDGAEINSEIKRKNEFERLCKNGKKI